MNNHFQFRFGHHWSMEMVNISQMEKQYVFKTYVWELICF